MTLPVSISSSGALCALLAGGILLAGCAQSDPVHTRNMAELSRLEACGYSPVDNDLFYPENMWAAERRAERGECGNDGRASKVDSSGRAGYYGTDR